MLLISARTLMSPYKKGLNGSLVYKNLYDLLTPIPVSKFEDKSGNQALKQNTTKRKGSLQILLPIATVLHKYSVKKIQIQSRRKHIYQLVLTSPFEFNYNGYAENHSKSGAQGYDPHILCPIGQ